MSPDKKKYLDLGQIYREHGVRGFCKFHSYSGSDDHLIEGEKYLLLSQAGIKKNVQIEQVQPFGRYFLVKFREFSAPEPLVEWRKAVLWLDKSKLAKTSGDELYDYEWEGICLKDEHGNEIGTVFRVERNPLRQLVVKSSLDGSEVMIPCVREWILELDKDNKVAVIALPEGLV